MPEGIVTSRFGGSFRLLRAHLGMSQEELADRSGLHRTFIARVESGDRNVTLKSITNLARALEVSVSQLLAGSDEETHVASEFNGLADILLVEDNPDDIILTLGAFREARIANSLQVVRDGVEALEFLWTEGAYTKRRGKPPPSVILLDLGLPKLGGVEVLRRLKRDNRTRKIPVVILTASRKSAGIAGCKRLGAADYIVKPVDFHNFSEVTPPLRLERALLDPALRQHQ